jgi:hypothetical protein
LQTGSPGTFAADLSPGSGDFHNVTMLDGTLNLQPTDAERAGFGKDNVFAAADILRATKDAEQDTGTVFFHLDRRDKDIESTNRMQPFADVTNSFSGHVVKIGLQHHDVFDVGGDSGGADENTQDIRTLGKCFCPTATADGVDRHGGHGAEAVGESFCDCGSRRRGKF